MKYLKTILILSLALLSLASCKENKEANSLDEVAIYQCPMKCEGEKIYHVKGSCPVCKMDILPIHKEIPTTTSTNEISDSSIFNLTSKWNTEEGTSIELKKLNGKTLVMVMIYTTCKAACPRLVADMRNIEKQIPSELLSEISFVLF